MLRCKSGYFTPSGATQADAIANASITCETATINVNRYATASASQRTAVAAGAP